MKPANTTPVRVGLVGLGFMAATHIKAYREVPGAKLVAICNPSGRNLDGDLSDVSGNVGTNEPVRLDMQQVRAYRSFEELLADPTIDLVDLCTPTLTHPEMAIAALRAGKHVLCEKPLARTSKAAREMVQAAATAKGFIMPAMCMRFFPEWLWLKRAIDDQRFGKILSAHFRRMSEPPGWSQQTFLDAKKSGGALLDLHIHDSDFVQYCFGRPRHVTSAGYSQLSGGIDHVVTLYEVDSGALVQAEGSWALTPGFGFRMTYTAHFERATADYDLARGAEALHLYEAGQPMRKIQPEGIDGYVGELRYFIDCIAAGRAPTVVTVADGLSAVEICEAEENSISLRQKVPINKT